MSSLFAAAGGAEGLSDNETNNPSNAPGAKSSSPAVGLPNTSNLRRAYEIATNNYLTTAQISDFKGKAIFVYGSLLLPVSWLKSSKVQPRPRRRNPSSLNAWRPQR